jgi:hypothetical protein
MEFTEWSFSETISHYYSLNIVCKMNSEFSFIEFKPHYVLKLFFHTNLI